MATAQATLTGSTQLFPTTFRSSSTRSGTEAPSLAWSPPSTRMATSLSWRRCARMPWPTCRRLLTASWPLASPTSPWLIQPMSAVPPAMKSARAPASSLEISTGNQATLRKRHLHLPSLNVSLLRLVLLQDKTQATAAISALSAPSTSGLTMCSLQFSSAPRRVTATSDTATLAARRDSLVTAALVISPACGPSLMMILTSGDQLRVPAETCQTTTTPRSALMMTGTSRVESRKIPKVSAAGLAALVLATKAGQLVTH